MPLGDANLFVGRKSEFRVVMVSLAETNLLEGSNDRINGKKIGTGRCQPFGGYKVKM